MANCYIYKILDDPQEIYAVLDLLYSSSVNLIFEQEGICSTSSSFGYSESSLSDVSSSSSSSSSSYIESIQCIQVTGFGEANGLYQYSDEYLGHHRWTNGSYSIEWFVLGMLGFWAIRGSGSNLYVLTDQDTEYPEGSDWQQGTGLAGTGFTFATECYPASSSSTSSESSSTSSSSTTSSTSSESSSTSSYSSSSESSTSSYSSSSSTSSQSFIPDSSSSSSIDSSSSTSSESNDQRDIYLQIDYDNATLAPYGRATNFNLLNNNRLVITNANNGPFDTQMKIVFSWQGHHVLSRGTTQINDYTVFCDVNFDDSSLNEIFVEKGEPEHALIIMTIYRYANNEYTFVAHGVMEKIK